MNRSLIIGASLLLLFVAGCDKKSQVVGTWEVEPAPTTSNNPGDVGRAAMQNLWTQNMKVEFTKDNKVRFTNFQGETTGTYSMSGDEVTIKFNTFAPTRDLKLRMENGKLREATEFSSDVGLTLVKK